MFTEKMIKQLDILIAQHRKGILDVANAIWKTPETGYREWKTSEYLAGRFKALGYEPVFMDNIPGFYADLDTGRPGPVLAVIGELDSVICSAHPAADPETGAVHACGHHTQCAYLFGAAAVLRDREILDSLCGRLRFVAVPAEELIEIGYRASLRKQGVIKYFGGKVEFLYRGVFDCVDAAVMIHSGNSAEKPLSVYKGNNGCLAKYITYSGTSAHAGGEPQKGINALYAASLGLSAINAIRETFVEKNVTRVHPIITSGGAAVNVIPDEVCLESFVRGATAEAIVSENRKVNRALAGAALSIGARIRVSDIPGYMPLNNDAGLNALLRIVGAELIGEDRVDVSERWVAGSTDMGDLSCIMPVVQPGGGGGEGIMHGIDYRVADHEVACVDSARCVIGLACALLGGGGAEMDNVKQGFSPVFGSYSEYFDFIDALYNERELVKYDAETALVVW
jgi:amidohydrolase